MKYDFAEIEKKLKKYLDKDRFMHTQGVMYTAAALAGSWNQYGAGSAGRSASRLCKVYSQ